MLTLKLFINNQCKTIDNSLQLRPTHPPVANYNLSSPVQSTSTSSLPDKQPEEQGQQTPDPLVSALSVSTVPGNQPEPILSMHFSQSIKKCI